MKISSVAASLAVQCIEEAIGAQKNGVVEEMAPYYDARRELLQFVDEGDGTAKKAPVTRRRKRGLPATSGGEQGSETTEP